MEFPARKRLFIIGVGPVGQQLAGLAAAADFEVHVLDDRASLLTTERFPGDIRLLEGDLEELLLSVPISPDAYVAIVSQVWQRDERALELLLDRPLAYLGMIGCRRKLDELFPALLSRGATTEAIDRVRAPIGLDIGSKTPIEIAISICAELIAVRRGRELPPSR